MAISLILNMKPRYSINNNNCLEVKLPEAGQALVADGSFRVTENNQLLFWLNQPCPWKRNYDPAKGIVFEGHWCLNEDYDLEFVLHETEEQDPGDRLVFKGKIISAEKDSLVFEMVSSKEHFQILKLSGSWQADPYNRISFMLEKKGEPDIFTFSGAWLVNKNQQITYTYEKTDLKRKDRVIQTLTFAGYWQICQKDHLAYILEESLNSRFDFRVQLESPNLYPQGGCIKYRLGLGVKESNDFKEQVVPLYGTWKFGRNYGISFLVEYAKGKFQTLEFNAQARFSEKDQVAVSLLDRQNQPLGIQVTFTHRFLAKNAAELFLRLKQNRQESGIEAGLNMPF